MKKYVLFTMVFLFSLSASAQYSHLYYHRVGDTIEQTPNNAYLEWWNWTGDAIVSPYSANYGQEIILQKNYTETPLKIIGLAAVTHLIQLPTDEDKPYESHVQEYLFLYDANGSDFVKLAEVPWDTIDPHRQLHITHTWYKPGVTNCCGDTVKDVYLPLYEYYFKDPFIVTDSFYIGGSSFYWSSSTDWSTITTGPSYCYIQTGIDCPGTNCHLPDGLYKFMWPGSNTWEYCSTINTNYGGLERLLVYPIIEVDTTVPPADMCPNVIEGFAVTQMADSCLVATWDAFPNTSEVQIIYGPITVAQSDWDTVSVFSGNVFYLCDLDSAAEYYGFRARAICESAGDTLEWSALEWIPVESSASIAAEPPQSRLGRQVAISPNPVRGMLHLSSSATLLRVEIYNSVGILTYSEPASGHMADIDFGNMPEGTYIAVVTTLNGSTAKRFSLVR